MMRDHKPISIADQVFEQLERLDANTCMLFTHHPKPQRMNTAVRAVGMHSLSISQRTLFLGCM